MTDNTMVKEKRDKNKTSRYKTHKQRTTGARPGSHKG